MSDYTSDVASFHQPVELQQCRNGEPGWVVEQQQCQQFQRGRSRLTKEIEVNMNPEIHTETPFDKESPSVAQPNEPKSLQGGRGSVTRFPLSPSFALTANLDNLYKASQECRKEVNWKDSVLGFQANIITNLVKLKRELLNGTYKMRPYKKFVVHEPKERLIEATNHRDRIVQRTLCNVYLYNALTKCFVYDNGANQKGKGTTFARQRLKCLIHRFWRKHGNEGCVAYVDIHSFLRFDTPRCRA